uniref:Uncharacterized protein n=1 Tax=Arundo donax TaxID=35708 RepID=A0A0A9GQH9_ARUDO
MGLPTIIHSPANKPISPQPISFLTLASTHSYTHISNAAATHLVILPICETPTIFILLCWLAARQ